MTKGRLLKKIAEEILGREVARRIWGRIEIIGDIAVIRVPLGMDPLMFKPVAQRIVEELPYVRSVWAGLPGVSGPYRLRRYVHLAGEERSETVYREHGCSFKVDIRRVYVSPVLSYEHIRVARLVSPNEIVTNMFAGAGFFSIIMSRHALPRRVYSIDINPYAYHYMVENIRLNHVDSVVYPILGDAARISMGVLRSSSDRVLMPYPELALEYLGYALMAFRGGGGWLHVYLHLFVPRGIDPVWTGRKILLQRLLSLGARKVEWGVGRVVRMVGPRKYQIVLDVYVEV